MMYLHLWLYGCLEKHCVWEEGTGTDKIILSPFGTPSSLITAKHTLEENSLAESAKWFLLFDKPKLFHLGQPHC